MADTSTITGVTEMKDIWHEPGETPKVEGHIHYLKEDWFERQYYGFGSKLISEMAPWCYESDLVAMLHEMRAKASAKAEPSSDPAWAPNDEPLTPAEIRKAIGFPEATVLTPCKCGDTPTPFECNGLHSFGCDKCQWMCRHQETKAKAAAEWNKVMTEWKADIQALARSGKEPQSALDRQVGGSHYKGFTIQPVEFSERNGLTFIEGNIIKYICRYRQDGGEGVKDLRKVIDYVEKLIEMRYPEAKS